MQKRMLNDLFENRLKLTEVLRNYTLSYTSTNQTNVEVFLIKVSIQEDVYENFEIIEYDMNEYGTSEIYYGLLYKRKPLQTLVYDEEILPRKCLTYFSHLDQTGIIWNKSRFSLEQIEFKIRFENDSYPYEAFTYPYTLHSPNDLPYIGYGSVEYMMNGYRYFVYYTKVNIKRLENGFNTNCKHYDKHYIRSDCIWNCYQTTMMERQNSSDLFFSGYMMRQLIIDKISHKKFVNPEFKKEYRKQSQQILANCSSSSICPLDCEYTYYITRFDKNWYYTAAESHIYFYPKDINLFITYVPSMDFINLACNLGGLLGMWLGLSISSIFFNLNHTILNIYKKFVAKNFTQIILYTKIFVPRARCNVICNRANENNDS